MNKSGHTRVCLYLSCAFLVIGCADMTSRATAVHHADQLTSTEERKAMTLAEQSIDAERYRLTGKRLYAVSAEVFRDKEAEDAKGLERQALVTHYQYEGDVAIFTVVNITQSAVMNVERVPHAPVPLSQEEFVEAKQLALADPEIRDALRPYKDRLTIDPLVTRTSSEKDPLFGHRVVSLLFRVGSDYLVTPQVMVDLTSESGHPRKA
jgi:Cu2+-containing amine oxidase